MVPRWQKVDVSKGVRAGWFLDGKRWMFPKLQNVNGSQVTGEVCRWL